MSLFDEISSGEHKEIVWNKHGLLFRKWNEEIGDYYPEQMRIINKTITFTTDNWKTVRTAIGEYHYLDSKTGKIVETYGVNAETIIGKLIMGEQIELTNKSGSMVFNENGLVIDSQANGGAVFKISKNGTPVLYVDDDGSIVFSGSLKGATGTFAGEIEGSNVLGGTFADCTYTGGTFKNGTFSSCTLSECKSENCTSTNDAFVDGTFTRGTYTDGKFNDGVFTNADLSAQNFIAEKACYDGKYIINLNNNTEYGDGLFVGILYPNDSSETEKYSKTAGILFTSLANNHGDTEIFGNEIDILSSNSVSIKGDISAQNGLSVSGNTTLSTTQVESLSVTGNFNVSGTKSRLVHTDDGDFSLHAYETTTPYFGDIGTSVISPDGQDIVPIDYIFKNTINTNAEYSVFLQKEGDGDLWVDEKDPLFFIVKGTPNLKYSWELKAVQKDYEIIYMNEESGGLEISTNDTEEIEILESFNLIIKQLDNEEEWIG